MKLLYITQLHCVWVGRFHVDFMDVIMRDVLRSAQFGFRVPSYHFADPSRMFSSMMSIIYMSSGTQLVFVVGLGFALYHCMSALSHNVGQWLWQVCIEAVYGNMGSGPYVFLYVWHLIYQSLDNNMAHISRCWVRWRKTTISECRMSDIRRNTFLGVRIGEEYNIWCPHQRTVYMFFVQGYHTEKIAAPER